MFIISRGNNKYMRLVKIGKCLVNIDEILYIEETEMINPNIQYQTTSTGEFIPTEESKDKPSRLFISTFWFKSMAGSEPFSKDFYMSLEEIDKLINHQKVFIV